MAAIFEAERGRLIALAYGFLGSRSEAEDVVQEAWLRYQETTLGRQPEIVRPQAWLTTVVSRIALDRIRSAQRRRETYPGVWLPEPVSELPDPESAQSTRSLLSLGFLHLLEALSPEERVVFVMREAFEKSYAEIAAAIGKSEAACRQILARARKRVNPESVEQRAAVPESTVEQLLHALTSGDEGRMLALLADDAVLFGDGGGRVPSVLNPIYGASRIVRFFSGVRRKLSGMYAGRLVRANGEPAILVSSGGRDSLLACSFNGERVSAIYFIGNPDKLSDFAA